MLKSSFIDAMKNPTGSREGYEATLEREWFATENKREKKYANKAIVTVSKRDGIEK